MLEARVPGRTAWPVDISLGSLVCYVAAVFIHTVFVASWALLVANMLSDWEWYPWDHVAMNFSLFSLFLLHVTAVNLCVTMWSIGLWRSSQRMARRAALS